MLREDVEIVKNLIKEEIAVAMAALRQAAKPAVKLETPKPVVVEVETVAEAPSKKGK
jgi:hypothetical protein